MQHAYAALRNNLARRLLFDAWDGRARGAAVFMSAAQHNV
jgi:hypothetical protein